MTLEEKFVALMKIFRTVSLTNEELKNENEYLQKQLGDNMKQKYKALESPARSIHGEEEASKLISSSSEDKPPRRNRGARRTPNNSNDFKIEIPKFEGTLDPDEFLDWLYTIEGIFDYKDIPKDKKVKLVTLR